MNEAIPRVRLLLSAQRALLGAISHPVIAVAVRADDLELVMIVQIDGSLDDDEQEALEVAASEIIADFPAATSVRVEYRSDEALDGALLVFQRLPR